MEGGEQDQGGPRRTYKMVVPVVMPEDFTYTEDKRPLQTYRVVIPESDLPVYEQAARQTGYGLDMVAKEGEELSFGVGSARKSISPNLVPAGQVQVAVTVPLGQEENGTTPFYDAVRALKQPPK